MLHFLHLELETAHFVEGYSEEQFLAATRSVSFPLLKDDLVGHLE
jgi:hypothetical protein